MTGLLERDDLLARLASLAQAAAGGAGRTVLVGGEAGIGKTSVLERFAAQLRGGRILWGGCEALATPRPLGPLHDLAMQTSSELRARLAAGGDRAVLFAAVLDEIARPPAPTVLVFEDVHWADEATLDLVKYLGRRIHRTPALLVLSHRDDVASLDRLRSVLGELPPAHVTRVGVPPLSRAAVERMTAGSPRLDGAGIHAATGGNAFFVAEILRQGNAGQAVPETVRDAVLARAASLSPAALAVLQLVAIVPRQVGVDLVERIAAPTTVAVESCLASGLLVADGRALRFRHELARTAVEASLSAPRAAQLHARVLAALSNLPEGAVSLAARVHHAQGAGDAEAVLRWAPQAAREAALRGARREAVAQCRTALAHGDRLDDDARAALLDDLATHSFELNDLDTAIAAREQAIALYERGCDADDSRSERCRSDGATGAPGASDAAGAARAVRVERRSLALCAQAISLVRALRNAEADAVSRRAVALAETLPPGRSRTAIAP